MIRDIRVAEMPPAELVARLADPHRYVAAYRRLLALGSEASEAAVEGLRHSDPRVRELCCMVLDHVADSESFAALIDALSDPAPEVRMQAIHALACDRCKEDECELDVSAVLPRATDVLLGDPDAHVRARAVELVGKWVHTHPEAAHALDTAARSDPSPAVRKKASWYARGGVIFRRTQPKQRSRPVAWCRSASDGAGG